MKVAIYIRVSTDIQEERGSSLPTQEERCRSYAKSKGWKVVKVYSDVASAKDTNRPGLQQLFMDAENGKFETIIIMKLDRMFRNTRDFLDKVEFFEEKDIKFVCLDGEIDTSTPTGRLFNTMRAAFAEFERETISERSKIGQKANVQKGHWYGGPTPFGYDRVDKRLVINEEQAEAVRLMYRLYLERGSLRYVTNELNRRGIKTPRGKSFASTTVKRILTSETYCGKLVYSKRAFDKKSGKMKMQSPDNFMVVENMVPAIVDEETFNKVRQMIGANAERKHRPETKHLLGGIVYCSDCGHKMYGHLHRKKDGREYFYYRCNGSITRGKSVCEGRTIEGNLLESLLVQELYKLAINPEQILEKAQDYVKEFKATLQPRLDRRASIKKDVEKCETSIQQTLELYHEGVINKEQFIKDKKKIDRRMEKLQNEFINLQREMEVSDIQHYDLEASIRALRNFGEVYDNLGPDDQRLLLAHLLDSIVVYDHHFEYSIAAFPKAESPVNSGDEGQYRKVYISNRMGRGSSPTPASGGRGT